MKTDEQGYTLVELLIAVTIMVVASGAASAAIFQVSRNTEQNNDHMTVVRQVQTAGHWISRDAQTALSVTTDNLTLPVFLVLTWTESATSDDPIYHSVNYTIEDISDGIGTLKRNHWSSTGINEQTLIAQYIYYNPSDTGNTTEASYESQLLTLQLTARLEENLETREYKIKRRPTTFTY